MDEGNNNITKMLESLITKIDEQKVLHDKKIKIQAAFNTYFSQELCGLAKQIDLVHAEVDVTRKMVERSSSTVGSVTTLVHQALEPQPPPPPPSPPLSLRNPLNLARPTGPHVHLGDNPPPLIQIPPAVVAPLMGSASSPIAFYTNGEDHKPPKHDFPRFEGITPYLWINRCLAYFVL
ncbi:hypothetical protein D1007_11249 [Hordeum vulgare]|nr:hypothetical protein D1007_11249 [Hordeum vulgare]